MCNPLLIPALGRLKLKGYHELKTRPSYTVGPGLKKTQNQTKKTKKKKKETSNSSSPWPALGLGDGQGQDVRQSRSSVACGEGWCDGRSFNPALQRQTGDQSSRPAGTTR